MPRFHWVETEAMSCLTNCQRRSVPQALTTARLAAILSACWLPGCGFEVGPTTTNGVVVDGNRDGSVTSPLGKTSGEPNDAFTVAIAAVFDNRGVAKLQGTVEAAGDLDVFNLGALEAGDRVVIDTATVGSALDISVAVFDDAGRLTMNNDDRGGSADRFLDSFIAWYVRHASDPYYLVATRSAFSSPGTDVGSYTIDVEITQGFDVPAPAPQIVLLDFDGGVVDSPVLGTISIGPFDGGAISHVYRGSTATIKEVIREVFEQNYERFNVTIVTTDDPPLADDIEVSTVYFGGFDRTAFGIAESVDLYNADFCDDAIIFTESFAPSVFTGTPTAEELGIAIGNVGSHEAGHLLGLNHTSDDLSLMDDRSAADAFIEDQEFMEAPLSSDIMSIGTQDAVLLLSEIVGMYDPFATRSKARSASSATKPQLPGRGFRFRRH